MSGPRSKPPAIREKITYPTIIVTRENNPCLDSTCPFEHVLSCGHIVTTAHPDDSCAPNCHHVAKGDGGIDRSLRSSKAEKTKNGKAVSEKHFYCDACIETEIEALIPADLNVLRAEQRRAVLRISSAVKRGKGTIFRKCYIGLKVSAIPCYPDGTISKKYVASTECHPFDTAVPRSGENMFEDVDLQLIGEDVGRQEREMSAGENLDPSRMRNKTLPAKKFHQVTTRLGSVDAGESISPTNTINAGMQRNTSPRITNPDGEHTSQVPITDKCSTRKRSRVVPEDSDDGGEYPTKVMKKRRVAPLTSSCLNTRQLRKR